MDAARAFAASYVVIHHVANAHQMSHGLGMVFRFGQEAVLIFFLLSGFVIFANERDRALSPRGYYLRRFRRIYPPLLAAMLVSTLVAWSDGVLAQLFSVREMLATLAALQDISVLKPGVISDPYLGNDPLWSLSYEIFFYLIFPFVLRAWLRNPRWGDNLIGITCCLAYVSYVEVPNHFSLVVAYFMVWWAGAMAANAYLNGGNNLRSMMRPYAWLLALCGVAAGAVVFVGYHKFGDYPFLPLRHFAVGAVMLAVFGGPVGKWLCRRIAPLGGAAKWVASISYGLYVLHVPLLVRWTLAWTVPGFVLALVLLVASSYLVDRMLPKLLPPAPRD